MRAGNVGRVYVRRGDGRRSTTPSVWPASVFQPWAYAATWADHTARGSGAWARTRGRVGHLRVEAERGQGLDQLGGRGRPAVGGRVLRVAHEGAQHGLAGAVPEEVGVVAADQGRGAGTVVVGRQHEVRPAADHGERATRQLALRELGCPGDLVGHGGGRHRERVAVRVGAAGEALGHPQTGRPDGDVRLALAPGAAGGVGDHDADARGR